MGVEQVFVLAIAAGVPLTFPRAVRLRHGDAFFYGPPMQLSLAPIGTVAKAGTSTRMAPPPIDANNLFGVCHVTTRDWTLRGAGFTEPCVWRGWKIRVLRIDTPH